MVQLQLVVTIFVFVMALAFPAAAQQTDPTKALPATTSMQVEEPPDSPENETVEQKLERLKDWRDGRKARAKRLAEEQVPVVLDSDKQNDILADSIVVEVKEANEAAEEEVARYDTPAMRKIRKDRDVAEKRKMQDQARIAQSNQMASVIGCDASTQVLTDQVEQRRRAFDVSAGVSIVNASDISWNIRSESRALGHIVKDVCPGGSLGLQFVRSFWADFANWSPIQLGRNRNRQRETIVLVATGKVVDKDGKLLRTEVRSHTIILDRMNWEATSTTVFQLNGNFLPRERVQMEARPPRTPRVRTRTSPRGDE